MTLKRWVTVVVTLFVKSSVAFHQYPQSEGTWTVFEPDSLVYSKAHAICFVDSLTGFIGGEVGGLFKEDTGFVAKCQKTGSGLQISP